MNYKIKVLNNYYVDIPEGFETPSCKEVIRYIGKHELTVSFKKISKNEMDELASDSEVNFYTSVTNKKAEKMEVLDDYIRELGNKEQHLLHLLFTNDNTCTGNWIFFENLDDATYYISVEYVYEDKDAQKIAEKIVQSIKRV